MQQNLQKNNNTTEKICLKSYCHNCKNEITLFNCDIDFTTKFENSKLYYFIEVLCYACNQKYYIKSLIN